MKEKKKLILTEQEAKNGVEYMKANTCKNSDFEIFEIGGGYDIRHVEGTCRNPRKEKSAYCRGCSYNYKQKQNEGTA